MFTNSYFTAHYFVPDYFPRPAAEKVRYFYHRHFTPSYFTDHYFPGDFVTVLEPEPPAPTPTEFFGGGFRPAHIPSITAVLDLELPVPVVDVLAYVTEIIRAQQQIHVPRPQLRASAQVQAAGIQAQWMVTLPRLDVDGTLWVRPVRRGRTKADEEAEEQMLLEHYLLTLKGTD